MLEQERKRLPAVRCRAVRRSHWLWLPPPARYAGVGRPDTRHSTQMQQRSRRTGDGYACASCPAPQLHAAIDQQHQAAERGHHKAMSAVILARDLLQKIERKVLLLANF